MKYSQETASKKRVAILGSTGSIGTQALQVVREHNSILEVEVLTANNNAELLIKQAVEFQPNVVIIANDYYYEQVRSALSTFDIKVYSGQKAIEWAVQIDTVDIVLTAMMGYSGLIPTIKAIEAGKPIALANKETLVVAGDLITQLAKEKGVNIYPVDSEHSAIFQCLVGEFHNPVEKIILTASGGPFRGKKREELINITKEQALRHPKWEMGAKITIDSASLMNKGLEVIEAKWLFNLKPEQIEVWVHPQSIVHSMVQFKDGSVKAQMGLPDMKLPIQYALTYPSRVSSSNSRLDIASCSNLNFELPDLETFKNLCLAYEALNSGGNMACILNAANEIAVGSFLEDKIGFLQMTDLIEFCMRNISFIKNPVLEDYIQTDTETRIIAKEKINSLILHN